MNTEANQDNQVAINLEAGQAATPQKRKFKSGASSIYGSGLPIIAFTIFLIFFVACFLGPDPLLYLFKLTAGGNQYSFGLWGYSRSVFFFPFCKYD